MRLIDGDELKNDFLPEDGMEYDAEGVRYIIDRNPTIDPIRSAGGCYCRECVHLDKHLYVAGAQYGFCSFIRRARNDDDFCSQGKLREAQDDE